MELLLRLFPRRRRQDREREGPPWPEDQARRGGRGGGARAAAVVHGRDERGHRVRRGVLDPRTRADLPAPGLAATGAQAAAEQGAPRRPLLLL